MLWLRPANKQFIIVVLFLLACVPGVISLLHSGFFVSDDGTWMIVRFAAFYEALRSGQFPVRYTLQLNNGFGYPVVTFLYPLYLYLAVPIHLLRFSFVNSIKILFGLSLVGSGFFTYAFLRKKFGELASFAGGVCYMYFPYHLWDMYKRGSLGELVAMAIVPFIFWQIENNNSILTGIGIGLLILSHNTLAMLFLPFICIYAAIVKKIRLIVVGKSIFLGLGISAFFWIPALYEKQYTVFDMATISNPAKYFIDGNLGILGLLGIIGIGIGVFMLAKKPKRETVFFFLVGGISLFFALSISSIFWTFRPLEAYIQFPFRLLALSILPVSFFFAAIIHVCKDIQRITIFGLTCCLIAFSALAFVQPSQFSNFPEGYYSTNRDSTTVRSEYMPRWVKSMPENKLAQTVFSQGNKLPISHVSLSDKYISFTTNGTQNSQATIGVIDYPGWKATIDRESVDIERNINGLIQIDVPSGRHTVSLSFNETPLRLFSDGISILSWALCIGLLLTVVGRRKYAVV